MDYRDNRQRWAESHQVVHFYAGQWCTFTPALTGEVVLRVKGGFQKPNTKGEHYPDSQPRKQNHHIQNRSIGRSWDKRLFWWLDDIKLDIVGRLTRIFRYL